nr:MAG: putative coat protein [Leviviridae sp.]
MLGDTITVTHNAVSRVLSKINQDNYSARYRLQTATDEFLIDVRHSTESLPKGSALQPIERHNIEFRVTTFATATVPELVQIYSATVRTRRGSDPAAALLAAKALTAWQTDANLTKLIAWES